MSTAEMFPVEQPGFAAALAEAEAVRDEAMARAAEAANARWVLAAGSVVRQLAWARDEFTTDDVHDALARVDAATHDTRALGPVMRAAAKAGQIEATGRYRKSVRSECHARPVAIWRSKLR